MAVDPATKPEGQSPGALSSSAPPTPQREPPPPQKAGPCPAPSAELKRLFANAFRTAEQHRTREAHQAVEEALRMRLDELYQSGCRPGLSDHKLQAELERLVDRGPSGSPEGAPSLYVNSLNEETLVAGHAVVNAGALALYQWRQGKVRTRIHVGTEASVPAWAAGTRFPEMTRELLLLDFAVFQPPDAPEPLLAISNTHPWPSSCWRGMRFRILEPTSDWLKPRALLDRSTGGRWCADVKIRTNGSDVTVHYVDWAGELRLGGEVGRPYARSFRYGTGTLVEHFGFATVLLQEDGSGYDYAFPHFVEDWLTQPWSLVHEATAESARSRLEALHERLSSAMVKAKASRSAGQAPVFSHELFPEGDANKRRLVVYCAFDDGKTRCPDWPKPVDFILEKAAASWIVADVKPR